MIDIKKIKTDYLISAAFGILALILSVLIGTVSGNRVLLVLSRALINMILFSIMGFVCLFVIKKYVPEMYKIVNSNNSNEDIKIESTPLKEASNENINNDSNKEKNIKIPYPDEPGTRVADIDQEDKELENEFNKFDNQGGEFSSFNNNEKDSSSISRPILKERKIEYEPKIAAQAIRTMLKRDE